MTEKKEYRVRSCGTLVPVTQEVYQAYYQAKRHDKTLCEKDERNGLVSYDGMDTEDILGEEVIPDRDTVSVEDTAIANILRGKLRYCLTLLDAPDWELIHALYFEGMSERQLAKRTGIPQRTINDRKQRTLRTLKKLLEN